MLTKTIATLGLALLATTSAYANVVYNWQSTGAGQYAEAVSGQLVVTDAAYRSGSASVDYASPYRGVTFGGPYGSEVIGSPITSVSLQFDYDGVSGDAPSAQPGSPDFANIGKSLTGNLMFAPDGLVSGSLDLFGETANFDSQGTGKDWSISDLNSDYFTGAGHCTGSYNTPCSGGTGFWRLDPTSVATDVPAPPVASLFGLAIIGVFGLWRRRLHPRLQKSIAV